MFTIFYSSWKKSPCSFPRQLVSVRIYEFSQTTGICQNLCCRCWIIYCRRWYVRSTFDFQFEFFQFFKFENSTNSKLSRSQWRPERLSVSVAKAGLNAGIDIVWLSGRIHSADEFLRTASDFSSTSFPMNPAQRITTIRGFANVNSAGGLIRACHLPSLCSPGLIWPVQPIRVWWQKI